MAQSLEAAQINAESINMPSYTAAVSGYNSINPNQACENKVNNSFKDEIDVKSEDSTNFLAAATSNCYNCGRSRHPRRLCPARDATCHKCSRKGHFAKHCTVNYFQWRGGHSYFSCYLELRLIHLGYVTIINRDETEGWLQQFRLLYDHSSSVRQLNIHQLQFKPG